VVCRPPSPAPVEWLSLRVGLALADRLEQDTGLAAGAVQIKWPNDLYVADRKLAGILSEARWQGEMLSWVVVGVGVNVSNPLPAEASPAPIRLADLGTPPPLPELANRVAATIAEQTGRADRLDEGELARFAARDWLRGRVLAGPVPGIADGIAADGRLKVQDAAGNSTLVAGGIELA
jgi:BirA family biotin operon repressor/biotin-[acetyl-CoA-carboxylase] ligase